MYYQVISSHEPINKIRSPFAWNFDSIDELRSWSHKIKDSETEKELEQLAKLKAKYENR